MSGVWSVTLLVAIVVLFSAVPAARNAKLGGWFNIDKNDKGLLKALHVAITDYNNKSKDPYGRKIISVTKARKQLGTGTNYEAQVVTGQTTCKNPIVNIDACTLQHTVGMLKRTRCTFQLYVVPWLNKTEVKKSICF